MLAAEVIEPALSDWVSPIDPTPKKVRIHRLCLYNQKLDEVTVPLYQTLRMAKRIDGLEDETVYLALDDNSGYW